MTSNRPLCSRCGGNGTIKIPGGVSVCPACDGECYGADPRLADLQRDLDAARELNEWYEKRCGWYQQQLTEAQTKIATLEEETR